MRKERAYTLKEGWRKRGKIREEKRRKGKKTKHMGKKNVKAHCLTRCLDDIWVVNNVFHPHTNDVSDVSNDVLARSVICTFFKFPI